MFENNAIFWVEVDKIRPNPYQPRREFDEARLRDLADSIRQYGVLQPIVVSRIEVPKEDGGLAVEYELIAGERRVRASKLAGISQIPVIIRGGPESDRMKLELAIIENLQREDLNPIDRARAFARLVEEFGFSHSEIGRKIGKSRVSVTNTIRILSLPEEILGALAEKKINEGHTRPLLMLATRPEEQTTLFREIIVRQMPVREAEGIARRIAVERAKKKMNDDPEMRALERSLSERFGTRVWIEPRGDVGGKVVIDYFSPEDLSNIIALLQARQSAAAAVLEALESPVAPGETVDEPAADETGTLAAPDALDAADGSTTEAEPPSPEEQDDADLYTVKNFTI